MDAQRGKKWTQSLKAHERFNLLQHSRHKASLLSGPLSSLSQSPISSGKSPMSWMTGRRERAPTSAWPADMPPKCIRQMQAVAPARCAPARQCTRTESPLGEGANTYMTFALIGEEIVHKMWIGGEGDKLKKQKFCHPHISFAPCERVSSMNCSIGLRKSASFLEIDAASNSSLLAGILA